MIYFFHHYELPIILQQARIQQIIIETQQQQQQQTQADQDINGSGGNYNNGNNGDGSGGESGSSGENGGNSNNGSESVDENQSNGETSNNNDNQTNTNEHNSGDSNNQVENSYVDNNHSSESPALTNALNTLAFNASLNLSELKSSVDLVINRVKLIEKKLEKCRMKVSLELVELVAQKTNKIQQNANSNISFSNSIQSNSFDKTREVY